MNIFAVDQDPVLAAQALCDRHVVKMVLESAQLLCSPFAPGTAPYKRTHYNHPCAVWARSSWRNYDWLLEHSFAIGAEYTHRYGKVHKSMGAIEWCNGQVAVDVSWSSDQLMPFAQCMPDIYRGDAPIAAYRRYYCIEKASIATWTRRDPPDWWSPQPELALPKNPVKPRKHAEPREISP